jgi:hypothetical protein
VSRGGGPQRVAPNLLVVVLPLLVALVLAALGSLIVAAVIRSAIRRLGLDVAGVLLWFGLAEALPDERSYAHASSGRVLVLPSPSDAVRSR